MASVVSVPNKSRRLCWQSVVQYPGKPAAELIDAHSFLDRDKGFLSAEERISFVTQSNGVKPPVRADIAEVCSTAQDFSSFQAIVFVNEKSVGKLLDPSFHFEDHNHSSCETEECSDTPQVAHLVYSKWQPVVASSTSKSFGPVQPLSLRILDSTFESAQIRIKVIGRQQGQLVDIPDYCVPGKALVASVRTQRQLLDIRSKQQTDYYTLQLKSGSSQACKEGPAKKHPVAQQGQYLWCCGSAASGCIFTFNIEQDPAWVKQLEVCVPVLAHPTLDVVDNPANATLESSSSFAPGVVAAAVHDPSFARVMAAKLAGTAGSHKVQHAAHDSRSHSLSQERFSSSGAESSSHTDAEGLLKDADFPPLSASLHTTRRSRSSSDQSAGCSEDRTDVSTGTSRASVGTHHLKSRGITSRASQPSGSSAGGSGDPDDDDGADSSSNRSADDGSSSSSNNSSSSSSNHGANAGRKGAKQCSGGAGGNEDDDEFRRDRPQCGAGAACDETSKDENEVEKGEASIAAGQDDTGRVTHSAKGTRSTLRDASASAVAPPPAPVPASASQASVQPSSTPFIMHPADKQALLQATVDVSSLSVPLPRLHESNSEPLLQNPSTTFQKQQPTRFTSTRSSGQLNGRHQVSGYPTSASMPVPVSDTATANGVSDAAVLERLLAESPIAFLTQNREHAENGFTDGASTSSDEGSVLDGVATFSGDAASAGAVSSLEGAQHKSPAVDVFDSSIDFLSKRKYRHPHARAAEQLRKQPNRTPNGSIMPSSLSSTSASSSVSNSRAPHAGHSRLARSEQQAGHSSRTGAHAVPSGLPEMQPVPIRDPRGMSDLERFLEQATPYINLHSTNPNLINTLSLEDVWKFYHEPSLYGREVLTYGGQRGTSFSYFVPYLSAIQLFVPAKSGDPGTDKLYECDIPDWPKYMHLVYEFFDRDPPFNRPPMFVRMEMLSHEIHLASDGKVKDGKLLLSQPIKELHPCSWYAVAWYPVYRIPDAPLTARFLTFHSFAPLVPPSHHFPPSVDSIPLQVSGLKWYNMMHDRWFENLSDSTTRNEQAMEEGSSRGYGKNSYMNNPPNSIDPEWQHHLEELQSTADRLARGVGLRVLGNMGPAPVELDHPDWKFFHNRM